MTTRSQRSRGMPRRSEPVAAPRRLNPLLLIGGAVAVLLVIAAVVAVALSGGSTSVNEPATSIQVSGSLPAFPGSGPDPAAGEELPTLSGTGVSGAPLTISPDDGPMAVVILAHWCSHCQAEVPVLTDYLAANGMPEGVTIKALSTSIQAASPNYPPSAWLQREEWPVPTLTDDAASSGLQALGVTSFPGFVFVDAEGRVVQRMTGEIGAEAFDQIVRSLAP
jgi:hypothetical protein